MYIIIDFSIVLIGLWGVFIDDNYIKKCAGIRKFTQFEVSMFVS